MPESLLPARIRKLLSALPNWADSGQLLLRPDWQPLREAAAKAPSSNGLYALGIQYGLQYELGRSEIIYIGSSKDLRKRLKQHLGSPQNEVIEDVQKAKVGSLLGCYWLLPKLPKRWIHGLEGECIRDFGKTFGFIPICNQDIPVSSASDLCEGVFRIHAESKSEITTAPEEIASRVGKICRRERKNPIGDPGEVTLTLSFDKKGKLTTEGDTFTCISFIDFNTVAEKESCAEREKEKRERQLLDLSIISQGCVALWSEKKMSSLIGICKSLEAEKAKKRTSVSRFVAPQRDSPRPHTWGEIALVQARIIAGKWRPHDRVWIKIVHKKALLGQAMLKLTRFYGEDVSDLPQRKTPRPDKWEEEAEGGSSEDPKLLEIQKKLDKIERGIERLENLNTMDEEVEEQMKVQKRLRKEEVSHFHKVIEEFVEAENEKRFNETVEKSEKIFLAAFENRGGDRNGRDKTRAGTKRAKKGRTRE